MFNKKKNVQRTHCFFLKVVYLFTWVFSRNVVISTITTVPCPIAHLYKVHVTLIDDLVSIVFGNVLAHERRRRLQTERKRTRTKAKRTGMSLPFMTNRMNDSSKRLKAL